MLICAVGMVKGEFMLVNTKKGLVRAGRDPHFELNFWNKLSLPSQKRRSIISIAQDHQTLQKAMPHRPTFGRRIYG